MVFSIMFKFEYIIKRNSYIYLCPISDELSFHLIGVDLVVRLFTIVIKVFK